MKNVLVVDDEKSFLLSLADGFSAYAGDFNFLTAENGKIAVEILKATRVDLLVTDLKMPYMDGFELLAYMSKNHPSIPVIVMTAFGSPEIEERLEALGISQYLEKPLDFDVLVKKIFEELTASAKGYIRGISLTTFLQLVEMEKKTYTLTVKSKEKGGHLYFQKGRLMDAETGNLQGEEAAYEIIGWEPVEIEIEGNCKKKKNNIDSNLTKILLEGLRLKDESNKSQPERRTQSKVLKAEIDEEKIFTLVGTENRISPSYIKEEKVMGVQDKLKELSSIDGFTGVGVFTPTGEALASLVNDGKVNIKDIGVLANNVLMNAQKASLDMGTGRGQLVHVEAEKAHIVVRCLNEGTDPLKSQPGKAHIHMVLILNSEASIGMGKLKVGKVIESLAEDFRG